MLKLQTKLLLLSGLYIAAFAVVMLMSASALYQRMVDGRLEKLRAQVNATAAIAQDLHARTLAGTMTRAQAMAEFRDIVHAIRFDDGIGYIGVLDADSGVVLIHGVNRTLEGRRNPTVAGLNSSDVINGAIRTGNEGIGRYRFPKPHQSVPVAKIVAVERFAPWNMAIYSGAYFDDLDGAYWRILRREMLACCGLVLLAMLGAGLLRKDITGSIGRLKAAMERLAAHDLDIAIPGLERHDELRGMAVAVQVFKESMIRAEQLSAEQERLKQSAEAARKAALGQTADLFEARIGTLVSQLSAGAAKLQGTAQSMSGTATQTDRQATHVAAAAAKASSGVQTVAASAAELTSSIQDISRQVAQSAQIAGRAVADARRTDITVRALAECAAKIGNVVQLISGIAAQTNLLALNATIEAARAGDAGKGFAVVAGEVKSLAAQTAKATEEIGGQITQIQSATGEAVNALTTIGATIDEVNAIAANIAAAVEQQGTATAEIARNVQDMAASTQLVTSTIASVSQAANGTGEAAGEVLGAANDLSQQTAQLTDEVTSFVGGVRAA